MLLFNGGCDRCDGHRGAGEGVGGQGLKGGLSSLFLNKGCRKLVVISLASFRLQV